jgi:hypothetical protein
MITHTPNIEFPNMRPDASPGVIEVRVTEASQLDPSLDAAVELIKEAATEHGTGIMITRLGPGHYIVRAHPEVPHGLIRQQYV